jgi:hypothetical protein
MKYKILYKPTGLKYPEVFATFQIEAQIQDFCYANEYGFFFLADCCLGQITSDGSLIYPLIGKPGECLSKDGFKQGVRFSNPSSITFQSSNKKLFVVEDFGCKICSLEILQDYYRLPAYSNDIQRKINYFYIRPITSGKTSIAINQNFIAWSTSKMHRVFMLLYGSKFISFGSGTAGFSVASSLEYHNFNCPSGLAERDKQVLVSDKMNHCIRSLGEDGHDIIVGHPYDQSIEPEKLVFINNILCFISKNSIFRMASLTSAPLNIFSDDGLVSFTNAPLEKIAILVKE